MVFYEEFLEEKQMKFSIIIPLYNKAPYICKALESVLAQTYTDYELIVVDDGSTDESASIVETMLCEAMRLQGYKATRQEDGKAEDALPTRLIAQSPYRLLKQQNAGVSAARNNGVAQATGEYLAFLDADDWWEPTYLERMAQLIKDYPEAGLYACNYVYYKPGKTHVALDIPTGYINYPEAYYESGVMPVTSITAIMPRAVFDEMGGFRNHLWMAEDFDLWIRIVLKYKVVFLNEPLAYYNQEVQLKWRALGKLYPPLRQFAFDADYLIPYQENDRDIKHVVDMVKIVCLKQYYISLKYHQLAVKELEKIDLNEYRNQSFASYIWQPLWKLRILTKLCDIYKILKNK